MAKNNTTQTDTREKRHYLSPVKLRNMAEAESKVITGTGIVFNQRSRIMTDWKSGEGFVAFQEIIMPESVRNINFTDVVTCYNHQIENLLGTGYAGTARYVVNESGVDYEVDDPDTDYSRNLLNLIARGDIRGSSFMFTANEDQDEWTKEGDLWIRRVFEFSAIYEMGPVFGEAYLQTKANYRSFEKHVLNKENPAPELTLEQQNKRALFLLDAHILELNNF
jgi:uncharacterized protein